MVLNFIFCKQSGAVSQFAINEARSRQGCSPSWDVGM